MSKRVAITGGSSGVGEAAVARLAAAGHELVNLDRKPPPADVAGARYVPCDLADAAAIDAAVEELPSALDAIINVAGIARAEPPETVIAVNFLGLRHLTERLLPRLASGGAVLSVSSIAGRDWAKRYSSYVPFLETGSMAEGLDWLAQHPEAWQKDPYGFSKRCVTAWTLRTAERGIREQFCINCISPGVIDTPLSPDFTAMMGEDHNEWMHQVAGRGARPEDIAEVIELLALGEANWLNGVDVPVDGGYTAGLESGWLDFENSPLMRRIRARREARGES